MITYTASEYRSLVNPIEDEGGWELQKNPYKHYYDDRAPQTVKFICMHITVGMHDIVPPDLSAESTAQYGATTSRQASWHVVIDSDSIIPCLPDRAVAWAQGVSGYNFNRPGIGVEIGTDQTDWTKKSAAWKAATLRNVAVWLAPRVMRYGIPLKVYRNRDEIQSMLYAGQVVGFTNHGDLDIVNRTDPGLVGANRIDTFPWEQLFTYIREEIALREANMVLKIGSRGDAVTQWQQKLTDMLYKPGTIDGVFGVNTETATKEFQADAGLTVDGVVGSMTQEGMTNLMSAITDALAGIQTRLASVESILTSSGAAIRNDISLTRNDIGVAYNELQDQINGVSNLIMDQDYSDEFYSLDSKVSDVYNLVNSINTEFDSLPTRDEFYNSLENIEVNVPVEKFDIIIEGVAQLQEETFGAVLRRAINVPRVQ